MTRYVAFLRGINVGGNNKVSMKDLKVLFEQAGFKSVSTYINSGNVIFDTKKIDEAKLAEKLEKAIEKRFGFPVRVVVRSAKNIENLAKHIPKGWSNDAKEKTDVLFLWPHYDTKKSIKCIVATPKVDSLKYIDGAIAWNVKREHYNKSGMKLFVGSELYKNMTARNVNTVRKLAKLMKES